MAQHENGASVTQSNSVALPVVEFHAEQEDVNRQHHRGDRQAQRATRHPRQQPVPAPEPIKLTDEKNRYQTAEERHRGECLPSFSAISEPAPAPPVRNPRDGSIWRRPP